MKIFIISITGVVGGLLLTVACIWLGLFREIVQPFVAIPERIRLLSYLNYMALISGPIFILGLTAICCNQLFYPTTDRFSYYDRWWKVIIVLTITVATLAFFSRVYLGYRVDQANYIKCIKESRTSSKSSWRIYAKHEALCKSSSGIAGG